MDRPHETSLPANSHLAALSHGADLIDAFAISLPPKASDDVTLLARAVLAHPPSYVVPLMATRDGVMKRFGIKTSHELAGRAALSPHGAIGPFSVHRLAGDEIIMGGDDRHLDFHTSMLIQQTDGGRELIWISVVHCHNLLGRAYLTAIRPFHKILVPAFLRSAARYGWPTAAPA